MLIGEVLAFTLRTEHQLSSANLGRLAGTGNWAKIEEMLEEVEMRQDANESFTQMCEDGKMENQLRGEVMQSNSPKS